MQEPETRLARPRKSTIPASVFTTELLPPDKRFAAWQESIGVVFDVKRSSRSTTPFNARVESYLFDDVMLARCRAGAQKFDRTPQRVACDFIDHYMIQLFLSGDVEMGGARRTPRHALVAFDFAEALDTFNSDFDVLSVVIPRRRLAPLLRRPDAIHESVVDSERGTGRLLAGYMSGLFSEAPDLRMAEAGAAMEPLLDLVALAFNGSASAIGERPDVAAHAALRRAQVFIGDNLARHDLGPMSVARHLGMSRAQLYRLFAPAGGISHYIREQRLRRCLADLLSSRHAYRQIAEIAHGWGFRDAAYFAKAFRRRFGHSPSDAREMANAAIRRDPSQSDDRVGDRLYEAWISGLA